ncbi:hypothetical protein COT62_02890 [Candidatus Roizmanbacteria bacterium CG09_land_8_20_14_0_10_41_9]|uniref:Peptidase C39-like domain-containing protein n=1 Tax=Candidatus Roizmanbacteria bacterium CG09_land_8_20_14_0_10_41_9 TaxID=1974850 RepID=A0A2H0WSE1_9BACT|nr:MAG: hypothetical protein COT62_02890 [Candidatus Roizmanbacteria bacterium CG09_land_8_20_14_0_10_41_9]
MKKALIIGLTIFLIILILLSLLLSIFRKDSSQETSLKITPIPTSSRKLTESLSGNKTISTVSPTNTASKTAGSELTSKVTTLSKTDFLLLEALKKSLPYSSSDFDVEYSPLLNMFIVTKKTSQTTEKFNEWAKNHGIQQLSENNNLFIFTNKEINEYKSEIENTYESIKNSQTNGLDSTDTKTGSSSVTPFVENGKAGEPDDSYKAASDLLKTILLMQYVKTTPTPVIPEISIPYESPSITNYPTNISPVSNATSSLSELFNEIGQKVGVPPKILEGIMMVEYPSTFDLSSEEIALYSTPGNTIPGCGPNQCSAAGPMQVTIGIDSNGSSSCSGCCGKETCLSSCPNAWLSYGGAVNTYGGYSHTPNPCNLRDNIYVAAAKLKSDSGATSATSWTQDEVYKAGKRYYGSCTATPPNLGGLTYCEYLWQYYTKNSGGTGSGSNSSESNTYSNYTYYSQCDDTYGDLALPGGCTLCRAGCGPTTAAMILSSKVDTSYTPQKLIDLYEQNGYQLNCSGSYYSNAKSVIEQAGVQTSDLIFYYPSSVSGSEIIEDVKSYIQAGWTIFALANFRCTAGSCGHFFWIVDVDAQNNILAFDPFYGRYEIPYNESAKSPRYRIGFGVK